MELKIQIRKSHDTPEETLIVSVGAHEIVINGKNRYAPKTKRYIVDQMVKRFIHDNFVDAKVCVSNHTILTAQQQTQPTGEVSVVINKFDENNFIEDEYNFIDEKCVFNNGEEIPEDAVMGDVIREYMEDIFFPKTTK